MALVKYNNNSISAITATGLASGAMTLIKSQTASASGTIDFVDGTADVVLDSTYPIYVFKFINIHPATNAAKLTFQANVSGGSGYNETITSTVFYPVHSEDDSTAVITYDAGLDQAQGTAFQAISDPIWNGNDECGSGELWLFGISSTTFVKHWFGTFPIYHHGDNSITEYTAGYFNTTSALDEFQFKMHTGNMDAGTIKLYGIKDS